MILRYLIIGNGRLAKHLLHYFSLLSVPCLHVTRQNIREFKALSDQANQILVLIPDDQVESFIHKYRPLTNPRTIWIHCSGALSLSGIESAHPLASFSEHLFDLEFYKSIPFFTEKGRKTFSELFPSLPNPHASIESQDKALYHAWSCMAGNFTTLLWQNFTNYLRDKHNSSANMIHPYLLSTLQNLIHSHDPLTGPLKRGDQKTIDRHLAAINNNTLKNLYQAFVKLHEENKT